MLVFMYSMVNKTVMKTHGHVTMEESKFTFLAEHLIRITSKAELYKVTSLGCATGQKNKLKPPKLTIKVW